MNNLIKFDIINGTQENKISTTFSKYLNIIKNYIEKDRTFLKENYEETKKEKEIILNDIENYILKKIYFYVFPEEQIEIDKIFYKKTVQLKWIKPKHFDIKQIYEHELKTAENYIKKMDKGKSVMEKIIFLYNANNTINNVIKFSSENDENVGADDLTPIFQYIVIKAQPERFYSNLFYLKCFMGKEKLKGKYGFLFRNLEFAGEFIMNISYEKLNVSEEEFNKFMKDCE